VQTYGHVRARMCMQAYQHVSADEKEGTIETDIKAVINNYCKVSIEQLRG